jgi:hypothetical protein
MDIWNGLTFLLMIAIILCALAIIEYIVGKDKETLMGMIRDIKRFFGKDDNGPA